MSNLKKEIKSSNLSLHNSKNKSTILWVFTLYFYLSIIFLMNAVRKKCQSYTMTSFLLSLFMLAAAA